MKEYSSMTRQELEERMTDKQRRFCEEYVIDWNASRAALDAGYSAKTAYSIGNENLKKPEITAYIDKIKNDLSRLSGVSALLLIEELKKIVTDEKMRPDYKINAIKELNNMLGHNAPTKTETDITSNGQQLQINPISFVKQDGSE